MMMRVCGFVMVGVIASVAVGQTGKPMASAQSSTTTPGVAVGQGAQPPVAGLLPSKDDLLRGGYGPYRANNDLLFYRLTLRVDPVAKTISGTNVVRFRMLKDGRKIQLELTPQLTLDGITFEGKALKYERAAEDSRTLYVDFPRELKTGQVKEVTVAYHGQPVTQVASRLTRIRRASPGSQLRARARVPASGGRIKTSGRMSHRMAWR